MEINRTLLSDYLVRLSYLKGISSYQPEARHLLEQFISGLIMRAIDRDSRLSQAEKETLSAIVLDVLGVMADSTGSEEASFSTSPQVEDKDSSEVFESWRAYLLEFGKDTTSDTIGPSSEIAETAKSLYLLASRSLFYEPSPAMIFDLDSEIVEQSKPEPLLELACRLLDGNNQHESFFLGLEATMRCLLNEDFPGAYAAICSFRHQYQERLVILKARLGLVTIREMLLDFPLPGCVSPEIARIIEMESAAVKAGLDDRSIQEISSREALLLLAGYSLLGNRYQECLDYSRSILSNEPDCGEALFYMACAHSACGRYQESLDCLSTINGAAARAAACLAASILADIENSSQSSSRAGHAALLLTDYLARCQGPADLLEQLILIQANNRAGKVDLARNLALRLEKQDGCQIMLRWLQADLFLWSGKSLAAVSLLQETSEIAKGWCKKWLNWETARALYFTGNFLSACDIFSSLLAEDVKGDSPVTRDAICCYYRAGMSQAAYEGARRLREEAGDTVIAGITEIEINKLVEEGKIESARDLLSRLVEVSPREPLKLTLLRMQVSLGEKEAAENLLASLDKDNLQSDELDELEMICSRLQTLDAR